MKTAFIISVMRFNTLSQPLQTSISALVAEFLATADFDLFLPRFGVKELLGAFRKFNIKVGQDGQPASAGMWRAINYLETRLCGGSCAGPCTCCGLDS